MLAGVVPSHEVQWGKKSSPWEIPGVWEMDVRGVWRLRTLSCALHRFCRAFSSLAAACPKLPGQLLPPGKPSCSWVAPRRGSAPEHPLLGAFWEGLQQPR